MRTIFLALSLCAGVALAAGDTRSVAVSSSTPTKLYALPSRTVVEVFNNGPNTIWCSLGASTSAAVGVGRPVASGTGWSVTVGSGVPAIWCLAETADQVAPQFTVVTQAQ